MTDADEKHSHDVIVRFEQMRAVFAQLLMKSRLNWSKPIMIIAVKNNEEFSRLAPTRPDPGVARGGFFLADSDPAFAVLDASQEDSWRAVSASFARLLLNFNYPPTQDWFDEGFAQYFSSLQLTGQTMQIGGDPEASATTSAGGKPPADTSHKSFTELLGGSTWISIPDLFKTHDSKQPMFRAESWMVMHYLLNKNKLPETGNYFGLVENEKLSIEDAIQKAYGMSSAQFEQAVKDYFHSLGNQPPTPANAKPNNPSPAPVLADEVGASMHEVLEPVARSMVDEVMLRLPEHREQARKELQAIVGDPKTDNAVAHRALGWDAMESKHFEEANDELGQASTMDLKDPWARYYSAQAKYRESEMSTHGFKGLANMMQDLHAVLDWDAEYAEAYSMLARAQTEGGGLHAAMDSIRAAIHLAPRNQGYLLQMAEVYMASKSFDAANNLLEQLSTSFDPKVASTARTYLHDLPMLRKYGIPPVHEEAENRPQNPPSFPPNGPQQPISTNQSKPQMPEAPESEDVPTEPPIDKRPIQFAKGTLVGIDCAHSPAAVLTILSGGKTLKLRTADYKSLTLIGADTFSCDWARRSVSVNYKASGKGEGDLVSLELH